MNVERRNEADGASKPAFDGGRGPAPQRHDRRLLLGTEGVGGDLLLSHLASESREWFVLHHSDYEAEGATEQRADESRALTLTIVVVAASLDERDRLRRDLPAHVAAAMNGRRAVERPVIVVNELCIDKEARRVAIAGEDVSLTTREFNLLMVLVERGDAVQSREALLAQAWDSGTRRGIRTVDTAIKRLRDKLGPASRFVQSVRGAGYRFSAAAPLPGASEWPSESSARETCNTEALLGVVTRAVA
jgi:DNA-binding winged helix-turn-helix (wHTH) protein